MKRNTKWVARTLRSVRYSGLFGDGQNTPGTTGVSPFPHGASPLIELANLDREVPIKVAHKLCHDPSGREGTQEVVVV